jgi:hypothetical protein
MEQMFTPAYTQKRYRMWDHGYGAIEAAFTGARDSIEKIAPRYIERTANGYLVKGSDRTAIMKSHESAVALVKAALFDHYRPMLLDIAKSIRALMKQAAPDALLDDEREKKRSDLDAMISDLDTTGSHVNHGTLAAIDDPTSNADPMLGREMARRKIDAANKNQRRVL